MTSKRSAEKAAAFVLIVDGDILSRHVIADYLRHCGYAVIEAADTDEALSALNEPSISIDIIPCDVAASGSRDCFALARWVREHRPELEVKLASGVNRVAQTAAELCENGPHLARPYEPAAVIDYIKRLRAARLRERAAS